MNEKVKHENELLKKRVQELENEVHRKVYSCQLCAEVARLSKDVLLVSQFLPLTLEALRERGGGQSYAPPMGQDDWLKPPLKLPQSISYSSVKERS